MAIESDIGSEDWKSAVTVQLYKGKGETTECEKYRAISFYSWKNISRDISRQRTHGRFINYY